MNFELMLAGKINESELVKVDSTEIKGNVFEFKGEATEIEYSFVITSDRNLVANFVSTEGISELSSYLRMYPNPAKDFVTIESAMDAVVKIYSVNGQMLSQQNISEGISTIDLSNLNAGMYFISVNETMVKVVKQ